MTFPLFKARFLAAVGSASQLPDRPAHSRAGQAAGDARTELQARREKLALFDKQCSRVIAGLYVGSDTVARSRDALRAAGITHVINCVCTLYPAYFLDELAYLMLNLHDTPAEDVLAVAFDVFDFIEDALAHAGRVFVHCSQGVSRSVTLVIAYLMWRNGHTFEQAFAAVKAARGVANPNIGFVCQMLNWQKRRSAPPGPDTPRMFRMAPQSPAAPTYLVPKAVPAPCAGSLDPRGAFVVHLADAVFVWRGSRCPPAFAAAAERAAAALARYEGAPAPAVHAAEGQEPSALLHALRSARGAETPREGLPECDAYTRDFQMYAGAASGAAATPGRAPKPKTPRCEDGGGAGSGSLSPNQRVRKLRRSGPAFGASPGRAEDAPRSPSQGRRLPDLAG